MEIKSFDDFMKSIKFQNLELKDFWSLGNATSLWKNNKNEFEKLNFHRGPLLYALIGFLKPTSIL